VAKELLILLAVDFSLSSFVGLVTASELPLSKVDREWVRAWLALLFVLELRATRIFMPDLLNSSALWLCSILHSSDAGSV